MINEPRQILVLELVDRLLRSWWTVVAGVCLGLAVGIFLISRMPVIYEARATINLASEKLPREFFKDIVTGDEDTGLQLNLLRRNVLSEPHLANIVEKEYGDVLPERRDVLTQQIRGAVRISLPRWSEHFVISFKDSDPTRAARIVNSLAEIYVQEKVRFNIQGAQETVEGLERLVEIKSVDIKKLRKQRAELLAGMPLESDPSTVLLKVDEAREELERIAETRGKLEKQLEYLRIQRDLEKQVGFMEIPDLWGDPGSSGSGRTGGASDVTLATLESELQSLLTEGKTDNHPDVIKKRRQIERHRSRVGSTPPVEEDPEPVVAEKSDVSAWDVQIQIADSELQGIIAKEAEVNGRLRRYQRGRAEVPRIQSQVDELDQELIVLEREYESLRTQVEQAKTSESVEEQGRGILFEILDYAGIPAVPVSPRPIPLYGMAVLVATVVFVGPLLVKSILVPMVGSEARLAAAVEVPVLVSIPTIPTPATNQRRWRGWVKNIGLSTLAIATLATVAGLRLTGIL